MAIDFLVDLQWGSCGKGKIAPALARRHGYDVASACNGPNAGHTTVTAGVRTIFKNLPSACLETKRAFIGAGAVIDPSRFQEEVVSHPDVEVIVHPRAVLVRQRHKDAEKSLSRIASTSQGTAEAYCDKLRRQEDAIAGHSLHIAGVTVLRESHVFDFLRDELCQDDVLHEVPQGFALSIDHGSDYPHCTSRNCTVGAAIDQLGVPTSMRRRVYGVFRPYPIRVGNTADGHSGGWYDDQVEMTWDQVFSASGMPESMRNTYLQTEMTTVTRRQRRVASLSLEGLRRAAWTNGVDHLILNFAQYVDWGCVGARRPSELTAGVMRLIERVEDATDVPVAAVGTGEDVDDIVWL